MGNGRERPLVPQRKYPLRRALDNPHGRRSAGLDRVAADAGMEDCTVHLLLKRARRLAGELTEGARECLRAVVAHGECHLRDALFARFQQTCCKRQANAPHRRGHRFAGNAAVDAVKVKRREVRHARQVFEAMLRHWVGHDCSDDARHAFPIVSFRTADCHFRQCAAVVSMTLSRLCAM